MEYYVCPNTKEYNIRGCKKSYLCMFCINWSYRTGHVIEWMLYIAVVVVIIWLLDLQLPVQLVPITTKVVGSIEPHSWWGVFVTTLCGKVCQWLAAGRWFSPGIPVSSTNKTDRQDMTEILLKVMLTTINLSQPTRPTRLWWCFIA